MMTTTEERIKILQMIQDGKISAEDGAKRLAALNESGPGRASGFRQKDSRTIRIRVTDQFNGKSKVSINLPLRLVDAGLNIASNFIPDLGIEEISSAIRDGLTGKIIDVIDDEDGERVEIFIE